MQNTTRAGGIFLHQLLNSFWTFPYLDHWSAKNAKSPLSKRRIKDENLKNAIIKIELDAPSEIIQAHRKIFVQI